MESNEREGKMFVSKQYGKGETELKEDQLMTKKFTGPVAEVSASLGLTVNLGNYESMRIDVGVKLPCSVNDIAAAHEQAFEIVEKELYKKKKELDSVL